MIRKSNLYARPKKAYQKARIAEENLLLAKYALKNKKEVWKTIAKINYFRTRAKVLARAPVAEQEVLFGKLQAIGLNTKSIADVLDLKIENLLERRLPSIVVRNGLAKTPRQARQFVVHKKVLVDGKVVNVPSFIVPVELENKISIKERKLKPVKEEVKSEESAENKETA
ncbi:MAG: 30S ribosomal protein S4 [archaeon]